MEENQSSSSAESSNTGVSAKQNIPTEATRLVGVIATGYSGNYKILGLIGRGGMSDVYKASIESIESPDPISTIKTTNVGRIVACKVLLTRLLDNKQHYKRFQHEAKLAKRLAHPNIVNVYDAGEIDDRPFMILEHVEGETLADVCRKQGKLSIERALPIFLQIAGAFAYAHLNNIVHRDLKPSNIMLAHKNDHDDFVKVVDFGIAKMANETVAGATQLTKTGDVLGTPVYMSPEQCRGEDIDLRSDIYSLGILMYEVLTGRRPFEGTDSWSTLIKQTSEAPKGLGNIDSDILLVKKIERIIFKCLEKEPSARYQSMDDLRRDLESVQLELRQIGAGEKNPITLTLQRIWLLVLQFVRTISRQLFSFQVSSSGLTIGSVSIIVVAVLALVVIPTSILLFAPSTGTTIADRELPFKPIVDKFLKLPDTAIGEKLWRKIIPPATPEPGLLEYSLKYFMHLADVSKQTGNFDLATYWYYRSKCVIRQLQLNNSLTSAQIDMRYAQSFLFSNSKFVDRAPNELLEFKNKKYSKLVQQIDLEQAGLLYIANAAGARQCCLEALETLKNLGEENGPEELITYGLLARSFQEMGETSEALGNYDIFYQKLHSKHEYSNADRLQMAFVLAFAGNCYLEQNQLAKAEELLSVAQQRLTELGDIAQYNLAAIYNDMGLAKEMSHNAREAEVLYNRANTYLEMSGQPSSRDKVVVLSNLSTAAFKAGDYINGVRYKLRLLISFHF